MTMYFWEFQPVKMIQCMHVYLREPETITQTSARIEQGISIMRPHQLDVYAEIN